MYHIIKSCFDSETPESGAEKKAQSDITGQFAHFAETTSSASFEANEVKKIIVKIAEIFSLTDAFPGVQRYE